MKNVTPREYRCVVGACPVVYRTEHATYILVGNTLDKSELKRLGRKVKVGDNETAIEIPAEIIDGIIRD